MQIDPRRMPLRAGGGGSRVHGVGGSKKSRFGAGGAGTGLEDVFAPVPITNYNHGSRNRSRDNSEL